MLAELLGKRVTLAVSEATSLEGGVEFSGEVVRLDPEKGPSQVTGIMFMVDAPPGSRYYSAQVVVTERLQGASMEEVLRGEEIPVNFQVVGAGHKFSAVGIGTLFSGPQK